jgi:ABC-type oligopeptide transport system substrate-binding subunit
VKKWLMAGITILVALAVALPAACAGNGTTESGLALTVASPQDESVVYTFETEVAGTTEPDAVVSVNGALVEVDAAGGFSTLVDLEEGPNLIEVLASDYEGNEASEILTVIYVV